jgi:molybdate transport system substrate-binding protein
MSPLRALFAGSLVVSAVACKSAPPAPTAPLAVAAAADLASAFPEIGAAFEKKTGRKVNFSFGSTGLLAKQIQEGARFDVFAAANMSFVDDVVKAGACDEKTKAPYAEGRLVMWSKKGGVALPASLADLANPRFVKIAIANPEHAPYGKAAKQALEKAGVWDAVKGKIVNGENVQQALQFAQTGNAEVAIVSLSLTIQSKDGDSVPIEPSMHAPLQQALVACKGPGGDEAARAFVAMVASPEGRAVLTRYGFLLPGEGAK